MGAEPVAAVDHQDPLRDPLQVHRPVERGVTAAHQQDTLSGEDRRVEDAVIQPPAVPVVRVLERQLARRERADPTGDEHGARRIGVPVGHHREAGRAVIRSAFEADDLLTEVHRSLPLQRLLRHAAHQVLGEDLRKSGNIEDVLLRIERRELAADLVERIDQATRGAAHPGVKGAEQSRRAGADDRDIFDVLHSPNRNGRQREKGEGSSERRRERVKIYTRTGDGGDTGLFGGGRVPKHDRRVEAYGQVDELNAAIGFALAQEPRTFCRELLETVQKDLFTIGAELATPDPEKLAKALGGPPLGRAQVAALEAAIDRYEPQLPALQQFILPGGVPKGAALHLARTVCRRAERAVVQLLRAQETGGLSSVVPYLNRLSDLLFVLARVANHAAGASPTSRSRPRCSR